MQMYEKKRNFASHNTKIATCSKMNKDNAIKFLSGGVMAGGAIGIAATIYLRVGGVLGAAMFAFGLIVVVAMKLPLFTGQAQHVCNRCKRDYSLLGLMLLLNIAGCFILSAITCTPEMTEASEAIITARLTKGPLMCGILAIPCGFIMTAAVRGAGLKNNWLPLLFGVPAFIICGFPHCVADSFYYASCSHDFIMSHEWDLLAAYLPTVLGNYIGCNLYRLTLGMPAWFKPAVEPETTAVNPEVTDVEEDVNDKPAIS